MIKTGKLARYKTFIFAEIADMGYYRDRLEAGFIRKLYNP